MILIGDLIEGTITLPENGAETDNVTAAEDMPVRLNGLVLEYRLRCNVVSNGEYSVEDRWVAVPTLPI